MITEPRGVVAVDKQGDRILFLDPRSLATVGEIADMPILPHEIALSPDRSRAFVPAYGDGVHGDNPHPNHLLSVIDLVGQRRVGDIDLSPLEAPHTLRFGPDGLLYVACENSAALAVIDVEAGRVVDRIETGSTNSHRLVVLGKSGMICTDNEEDATVSLIDMPNRRMVEQIELPVPIAGIAASSDEATLFCTDAKTPRLLTISVNQRRTGDPIPLSGHRKGSQVVRTSPDGKTLVVIGDHEPVVTLIDTVSCEQRLVRVGEKPMDGAFHPDNTTFLLADEGDSTLSEIDLRAARVRRTISAGQGCETLAYY